MSPKIVLGPCRCQGCGQLVVWTGSAWHAIPLHRGGLILVISSSPHHCRRAAA